MHFDDMIDPIWKRFFDYRFKKFTDLSDEKAIKAAFYWAIKDSSEQIYSEASITPEVVRSGGDDYLRHIEERRGYEIGKEINSNDKLFRLTESTDHYHKIIRKEVFIIKLEKRPSTNTFTGE